MAQTVKRLSTMRETWVPSLGQEDPLEKEMAGVGKVIHLYIDTYRYIDSFSDDFLLYQ